jgi:hypothetical protein
MMRPATSTRLLDVLGRTIADTGADLLIANPLAADTLGRVSTVLHALAADVRHRRVLGTPLPPDDPEALP